MTWKPHPGWCDDGNRWWLIISDKTVAVVYRVSTYHNDYAWSCRIQGCNWMDCQMPTLLEMMEEVESVLEKEYSELTVKDII